MDPTMTGPQWSVKNNGNQPQHDGVTWKRQQATAAEIAVETAATAAAAMATAATTWNKKT